MCGRRRIYLSVDNVSVTIELGDVLGIFRRAVADPLAMRTQYQVLTITRVFRDQHITVEYTKLEFVCPSVIEGCDIIEIAFSAERITVPRWHHNFHRVAAFLPSRPLLSSNAVAKNHVFS